MAPAADYDRDITAAWADRLLRHRLRLAQIRAEELQEVELDREDDRTAQQEQMLIELEMARSETALLRRDLVELMDERRHDREVDDNPTSAEDYGQGP